MDFIEKIKIILPKEKNLDLVIREVKIDYNLVELMFFSSLCNEDRLIYLISSIKKKKINRQIIYRINNSQVKKIYKEEHALHSLFDGLAIGSSIASTNVELIHTIFWAILLHKVSASLGVGIFIRQLHIPFKQCNLSNRFFHI